MARTSFLAATLGAVSGAERIEDALSYRVDGHIHRHEADDATILSSSTATDQGDVLVGFDGYLLGEDRVPEERVAELYREHGTALVDHIRGSFCIILHDTREGETHCITDRVGTKYCYHASLDGGAVLASFLSVILAHPQVDNLLDREMAAEFVQTWANAFGGGRTLVRDVHKTQGSQIVRFTPERVGERIYWDVRKGEKRDVSDTKAVKRIEELLLTVTEERVAAVDGDIQVTLSGGLDSTLLVTLLQDVTDREIHTYTFGYRAAMRQAGREMAAELGTTHEVVEQEYGLPDVHAIWRNEMPMYAYIRVPGEQLVDQGIENLFHGHRSLLSFPCGIRKLGTLDRVRFLRPVCRALHWTGLDGLLYRFRPTLGRGCDILRSPYKSAVITATKTPPRDDTRQLVAPDWRSDYWAPERRIDEAWSLERRPFQETFNYLDLRQRLGPMPAIFWKGIDDYDVFADPALLTYVHSLPITQRRERRLEQMLARNRVPADTLHSAMRPTEGEDRDFRRCITADRERFDTTIDRLAGRRFINGTTARRRLHPRDISSQPMVLIFYLESLYLLETWIEAYIDREEPWKPPGDGLMGETI